MSIQSQASVAAQEDRDRFRDAVRSELWNRGFRYICETPGPGGELGLWRYRGAENTVVSVIHDRQPWFEDGADPLDQAALLVGGSTEPDQLYLFEDVIWRWYDMWGPGELRSRLAAVRQQLQACVRWAEDCLNDLEPDLPEPVSFRELLDLAANDLRLAADVPSRSDLERRFSPDEIASTLNELSVARDRFLSGLYVPAQGPRSEPLRLAAQAVPNDRDEETGALAQSES